MSVTSPAGFRAAGVKAGLKDDARDVALVVNDGPLHAAAGVFTANRVKAAPVLWSEQVLIGGLVRAVVLNAKYANACTGPAGFGITHLDRRARGARPADRCRRGGGLLHREDRRAAADRAAHASGSPRRWPRCRPTAAATRPTRSAPPTPSPRRRSSPVRDGRSAGWRRAPACWRPRWRRCSAWSRPTRSRRTEDLDRALRAATRVTFDRVDSDGCLSTNDTVLLLASGASGLTPGYDELAAAVLAGLHRPRPAAGR